MPAPDDEDDQALRARLDTLSGALKASIASWFARHAKRLNIINEII